MLTLYIRFVCSQEKEKKKKKKIPTEGRRVLYFTGINCCFTEYRIVSPFVFTLTFQIENMVRVKCRTSLNRNKSPKKYNTYLRKNYAW